MFNRRPSWKWLARLTSLSFQISYVLLDSETTKQVCPGDLPAFDKGIHMWTPWGGEYSHFFCIHRLGPSIYHSPPPSPPPKKKYQEIKAPKKYLKF